MSYAFIRSLKNNERPTFNELLNHVREEMHHGGYSQKPQFSSGKRELVDFEWQLTGSDRHEWRVLRVDSGEAGGFALS